MVPQKKTPVSGRGRPKKNSPVSERRIYVYAETVDQSNQWKKAAKNAGMSISKFISELLEDHINAESTGTARKDLQDTIVSLENEIKTLRTENVTLSQQIERMNRLVEKYEDELRQLKQGVWLQNGQFTGIREYEQRLIELLKDRKFIREEEILDLIHISPTDTKAIKAIMKQLENLLDYGVIKSHKANNSHRILRNKPLKFFTSVFRLFVVG